MYLISQYLCDFGLKQTNTALCKEANLTADYKICDNVDLDTIYLDFCSYYHLKFGKLPKILRKIEIDSGETTNQRPKVNKAKSSDCSSKVPTEDCQKKGKKECTELSSNGFLVLNTDNAHAVDSYGSLSLVAKYRKNLDLFEQFVGESRELAYIIERYVEYSYKKIRNNQSKLHQFCIQANCSNKQPHKMGWCTRKWQCEASTDRKYDSAAETSTAVQWLDETMERDSIAWCVRCWQIPIGQSIEFGNIRYGYLFQYISEYTDFQVAWRIWKICQSKRWIHILK